MKKISVLVLVLLLFVPLATPSSASPPTASEAEEALLYCFHTDSILFAKNSDVKRPMGNTAQLMTSLLVLEAYHDLSTPVYLAEDLLPGWYTPGDYRTPADYGFKKGAEVPVKDLLAAMVIENANCAALLLASLVGGSAADFVTLMNTRAAALGMVNTRYKNPTGIDADGAYTTANDLLILSKLLYQNPDFMALASSSSYAMASGFRIYTRNYMIGKWYTDAYLYPNADGMKAGYTENAENTLVATATEADGYTYLAIVLGGKEINFKNSSYALAKALFRYGSTSFSYREVLSSAKLIATLPVVGGDGSAKVSLFPKESILSYLPKSLDETRITVEHTVILESIDAPFEKGTVVGEITVLYDGEIIGKVPLVTGNGVKSAQKATLIARLSGVAKPLLFVTLAVIGIVILRYVLVRHKQKNPKE